ncbi:MAG: hypothetical protein ABIP75_06240, partial [Pyrinomonadaceae bacterium]
MRLVRIFVLTVAAAFALAIPVGYACAPPVLADRPATAVVIAKEGDIYGFFFIKGNVPAAF